MFRSSQALSPRLKTVALASVAMNLGLFTAFLQTALPRTFVAEAFAEDSRGRLPDGRAFRKDAEGNQLVDYIAELELNNENLQKRVLGLEDEVKEKQSSIDRLRQEGRAEAAISEKTLAGGVAPGGVKETKPSLVTASCAAESSKIAELSAALDSAKADLEVERQVGQQKAGEQLGSYASLQQKYEGQTAELEKVKLDLASIQEKAAATAAELQQARADLDGVRQASAKAEQERRSRMPVITSAALVAKQVPSIEGAAQAAGLAGAPEGRASLSVMRLRAVEVIQGKLQTEVNQVRGIVATRDEMFRRYGAQKHAVAFTPSRAVSQDGHSLAEISKRVQSAQSMGELSVLSREIDQVRSKMNDDLGLMRRMERVRH